MKRNLWVLMKKDILLCPAWLILGVALTIAMPIYIISSIELPSVLREPMLILCAICAGNIAVSRICYIEDNQAVKTLLASLPVRKKELILSRYIVAVAIVIILIIVAALMGLLMGVAINAAVLWMGIVSGILYETIYLMLYFKWGNNVAQYAFVVIIVIIAGASWLLWF
ncbi:MAG: ABC-2 transporter permease [Firmicutes bacterium]|nr:ABC-2 transporter permease [Bacillota bacterium]